MPLLSRARLLNVLLNGLLSLLLCGCQLSLTLDRPRGGLFLPASETRLKTVDQAQLMLDWQVMQEILGGAEVPYILDRRAPLK